MSGERLTDPTFAFFQQLRLAGEHHEQPHKQLIRPPIARPVLAGERKKERRKEREKRSPRGLEKRKKLQRKEGRGDTGRQGGGSAHAPSLLFLFTHHLPLTPRNSGPAAPRWRWDLLLFKKPYYCTHCWSLENKDTYPKGGTCEPKRGKILRVKEGENETKEEEQDTSIFDL